MFSKLFGKKELATVKEKKESNNVKTETKVLPDNSAQSKCVDRILNDDVYKTHWAHIEYDLVNDKDVLITVREILEVEEGERNHIEGMPIITLSDLQYYIHTKEVQWLQNNTIEDARAMFGIELVKCQISAVQKGSQWHRLLVELQRKEENIELKIEEGENGTFVIYCKRFGLDTNSPVELQLHDTYADVVSYHWEVNKEYFCDNQMSFYDKEVRFNNQFNLLQKLYSQTKNANDQIISFRDQSEEHQLYFSSYCEYHFNRPFSKHGYWKDFEWEVLDNIDLYRKKCSELAVNEKWDNNVSFDIIAYNLCIALDFSNRVISSIVEDYPEDGYLSSVIESISSKKNQYDTVIKSFENSGVPASNSSINKLLNSEAIIKYFPQLDNSELETRDNTLNNRVYSLIYLAELITGTDNNKLQEYHINKKEQFEKYHRDGFHSIYANEAYYSYIVICLLNHLSNQEKRIDRVPIITYTKSWDSLNKKEKVAIKLLVYFVFVIDDLKNYLNIPPILDKSWFSIVFQNGGFQRKYYDFEIFDNSDYTQFMVDLYNAIESSYKDILDSSESSCNSILSLAQRVIEEDKIPQVTTDLSSILDYSGTTNLEAVVVNEQDFQRFPLILGTNKNGDALSYGNEGSLVTIAPPRSGKSRTQVIPNLKSTKSSVFVIDPKGECFTKTENERLSIADGRVYKFAPFDEDSDSFNPLEFIDKSKLSEDSKFIANLIIPENNGNDENAKFFRDLSVDFLSAVIVSKKLTEENGKPCSLSDVGDLLLESELENLLEVTKENRQAHKTIRRLIDQPEGTLQGVLATTQRSISVWEEDAIYNATSGNSDWTPESIKLSGTSIYICFPPAQIEAYSSVIRVLASLHIREALKEVPEYGQEPDIVFFLDELPSLGYMKPVEDAVYVGAQYGIRAWLFAQTIGQLKKLYVNAEGLIGACDVRCFMNPSQFENIAKKVSEDIGFNKDPITGERKPIISEHDISSEKYKDKVFVFRNTKAPVIVNKYQETSE